MSKYYRNQDDGTWANKPNETFNSGTTGFVVELHFRRYTSYYNCNVMIPVLITVAIGFFTVFLPPDSGDKLNLAVTVLLGFMLVQGIITQQVPKSAITPLLSLYVVCALIISTVNVASSACVVAIYHLSTESRPPLLVRLIGVRFLGCILCTSPRQSLANVRRMSLAGIGTLRSTIRRFSSSSTSPIHEVATRTPATLSPNRTLDTNHTGTSISLRNQLELHPLQSSSFNVSASSLVSRPSPVAQSERGIKLNPEMEGSGNCELEEEKHTTAAGAEPTSRVRLLVKADSQDSAENDGEAHARTVRRACADDEKDTRGKRVKRNAVKGETWQDFATVLNIIVSILYVLSSCAGIWLFLMPLWFESLRS